MGKKCYVAEKLHKLYKCKIKIFPLERSMRRVIYNYPKISESKSKCARVKRAHNNINVETPIRRTKAIGPSIEKKTPLQNIKEYDIEFLRKSSQINTLLTSK